MAKRTSSHKQNSRKKAHKGDVLRTGSSGKKASRRRPQGLREQLEQAAKCLYHVANRIILTDFLPYLQRVHRRRGRMTLPQIWQHRRAFDDMHRDLTRINRKRIFFISHTKNRDTKKYIKN